MKKYYLAYGSNMSIDQMAYRCPDAVPVGTALLDGWELVFRFHATIEPKKGATVPVLVWEISDRDERRLDRYEGYPKYYIKSYLSVPMVELKSGYLHRVRAMVYLMAEGRSPVTPPSSTYYDIIEEGYDRFGFDQGILRRALDEAIYQRVIAEEKKYF